MPKQFFDVSNQVFGKLTVLHCNLPPRKRALVKCICGKEFAIGISSLTGGKTTSCGATLCSTRVKYNLLGKKFGMLFVEAISPTRNNRKELYWICKCDCGISKRIRGCHISPGTMDNCGCQTKIRRSLRMRKPLHETFVTTLYNAYKDSAKSRNLEFSLTKKDFEAMLFQRCYYCNVDPYAIHVRTFIDGTSDSLAWNGLDRIDSLKGYTRENCVTCCKLCNVAKSNMSIQEFTIWVTRLTQNFFPKFQNVSVRD